ncbi:glycosyltransferase family 9 protein, partial [Jiangella rhizosphaerae]
AAAVASAAGLPPSAVLAGRLSLTGLAALVARARLVVSNDTGVAHLASAYGVPSVVLFGPTPPAAWGPPAHGPHVALWHGPAGDPHGRELDPALARIQPGEVLDAVATLLR